MRTFQIDINITDMSDFVSIPNYSKDKDAIPPKIHKYHIYSDSNNFYEAVTKAIEGMSAVYNKESCGRLEVSVDNKQIIDR